MSATNPRKEDIRGQLSDIQRKLFGANKPRPKTTDGKEEPYGIPQGAVPPVAPPISLTAALRRSAGSNAPALQKPLPQAAPPLRPEAKGQDMNFVVGLSENLLSECRRLTAENHKMRTKLRTQTDELADARAQVAQQQRLRLAVALNELTLKDQNWELEGHVAQLTEQLEALRVANDKLLRKHNESTLLMATLQRDSDEHQMKLATLQSDLVHVQDAYQRKLADLSLRVDALNDENDALHMRLSERSAEVEQAVPIVAEVVREEEEAHDFDSILEESTAVLRQAPENASDLQVETLRANLAHSNHTVARLRAALLKMKNAPSSTTSKDPIAKDTPRKKKPELPASKRLSAFFSPAKRNSKFIIVNDDLQSEEWPEKEDWDEYLEHDTPTKMAPDLDDEKDVSADLGPALERTNSYLRDSDSSELDFEAPKRAVGQRVLSQELSKALEITDAHVQQFAKDNNLVILTLDAFARLESNDISDMSTEQISAVVEKKGCVLMDKEEHAQLLDEAEMRARLEAKGLVTIPSEEYLNLKEAKTQFENPNQAYLSEKAAATGLELVSSEQITSFKKFELIVNTPTRLFLISKCKDAKLVPLNLEEYKRLQEIETDHEQPSKEYLTTKANEMGMILAASNFYDELLKKAQDPPKEHLEEMALKHDCIVVPRSEHEELVQKTSKPTLDNLSELAKSQDHVIVPTARFQQLSEPTVALLDQSAHKLGQVLLKRDFFEKLSRDASEPSLMHLKQQAEKHGLVTLSSSEYTTLYALAHDPTTEQITTLAGAKNLAVVQQSELERLTAVLEDPGLEFLSSKAENLGYELLPSQRVKDLENPTLESVRERARYFNHDLLEQDEYKMFLEPTASHLKKSAETLGLHLLLAKELDILKNPSLETLEAHAAAKQHKLMHEDTLAELQRSVAAPTVEELSEKAKSYNMTLVDIETLADLQSPTLESLKDSARGFGHKVVSDEEHAALHNPGPEVLLQKARSVGLIALDEKQHEKLQSLANEPSLERLEELSSRSGYSLVETSKLEEITRKAEQPTVEELEKFAHAHESSVISTQALVELKNAAESPSVEHLKRKSLEQGYVIVQESTFNSPSSSYLTGKADLIGHSLISKDEHEKLLAISEAPTREFLDQKCSTYGLSLIDLGELRTLMKLANEPDLLHVKETAAKLGQSVVDKKVLEKLEADAHTPPLPALQRGSKNLGFEIIPALEHAELVRLAQSPTLTEIEEFAAGHGQILVESAQLNSMQSTMEAPSLEFLKEKSKTQGYTLLADEDYKNLELLANNPPHEHLEQHVAKIDSLIIKKSVYESLVEPTVENVAALAHKHDYILVAENALQTEGSREVRGVQAQADNGNLVLVDKQHFASLESVSNTPSLDHLREKANEHKHILIDEKSYSALKEPSITTLQEQAKKQEHVVLSASEHQNLVSLAENPEIERISQLAPDRQHTILPDLDFITLKQLAESPSESQILEKALALGLVALSKSEWEKLTNDAKNPSQKLLEKRCAERGFSLLTNDALEKLKIAANLPNLTQIKQHAASNNHTVIHADAYKQLKDEIENPSLEKLESKIAALGFVAVPLSEFQKHLENKENLEKMQLITKEEYSKLTQILEAPSMEFLEKHAEKKNWRLVEADKFELMQSALEKPDAEFLSTKALAMGLAVVGAEELQALQDLTNAPSLEFLEAKAKPHSHSIVSDNELSQLRSPDLKTIETHLQERQMEAVHSGDVQSWKTIEEAYNKPSLDYLQEKAMANDSVVISHERELALLQSESCLKKPSAETLAQVATKLDHAVILNGELSQLHESIEEPLEEYLTAKADNFAAVLVKKNRMVELTALESLHQNPSLEYLSEKAAVNDHRLVSTKHFQLLEDTFQQHEGPDLQYLVKKAHSHSHVVLPTEEVEQLKKPADPEAVRQRAQELGYAVVESERLKELEDSQKSYVAPSQEYLEAHAKSGGNVILSKIEFDRLDAKDKKSLALLAGEAGFVTLSKEDHENTINPLLEVLAEKCNQKGHVIVPKESYEALLKQSQQPSLEFLTDHSSRMGQVLISAEDYARLYEPLNMQIEKAGLVAQTKEYHEQLQAQIASPKLEYLAEKADALDHVLLPSSEIEALRKSANLSLDEKASAAGMIAVSEIAFSDLSAKATRLEEFEDQLKHHSMDVLQDLLRQNDCVVVTKAEFADLETRLQHTVHDKAKELFMVAIPIIEFNEMKTKIEEPLESKALLANKALVDQAEYEKLQRSVSESLEDKCKAAGIAYVSVADHAQLLLQIEEPSLEALSSHAEKYDKVLVDKTQLTNLRLQAEESLDEKASRSGFLLISESEHSNLHQKANDPTLAEVKLSAKKHGMELVENLDLQELHVKANKTLDDHLKENNLKSMRVEEFDEMLLKANKPLIEQIAVNASSNGMKLLLVEEHELLITDNRELADENLQLKELVNSPPISHVKEKAMASGFVLLGQDEHSQLTSENRLKTLAQEQNLVLVDPAEFEKMKAELDYYHSPLVDDRLENLKNELRENGFEVVAATKYAFLSNAAPQSDDQFMAQAKERNMAVFSQDPDSNAGLDAAISALEEKGYIVSKLEFADAKEMVVLSVDELQHSSQQLGMICVKKDEYDELVAQKEKLGDKNAIAAAGAALSLAVVPMAEMTKLKQNLVEAEAAKLRLQDFGPEAIVERLRELNLVVLDRDEYRHLKDVADQSISESQLRERCEELGFTLATTSELHDLRQAQSVVADKSLFQAAAKKWNLLCVPELAYVPTTAARAPEPEKVTVIPTSYYTKLSRLEGLNIEKASEEVFRVHAEKRGYKKSPLAPPKMAADDDFNYSPSTSVGASPVNYGNNFPRLKSAHSNMSIASKQSALDSITGLSIATNISFTDRSMIPAITQVVIGEYLFKYYRKLGPLSSISAGRHERYFWVHPYLLTLYWSSSNPVLTNPSEVKTKAMAIERVESVDDPNPLPTGLHYKSILVHCKTKVVKITCPTRQRHNIWFNALRYLVNRSINDLNFGKRTSNQSDQIAELVEKDEDEDDIADFEPSTRHAFPRLSTILRSRTMGSLSTRRV